MRYQWCVKSGFKFLKMTFSGMVSPCPKRVRFYYAFLIIYLVVQIFVIISLNSFVQDAHTNAFRIFEMYRRLSTLLNEDSQLDNSGKYKILYSKETKPNASNFDITLVSQCSSNHLHWVENFFTTWEGPISVAVFSEVENIESTLWALASFLQCHDEDIRLHLVVPAQDLYIKDYNFGYEMMSSSDRSISCKTAFTSNIGDRKNYNWSSPYPINLLRNVAKAGSSTDYILVIDIDLIPSPNLRSNFLNYAWSKMTSLEKAVYVVPTFEMLRNVSIPENKTELIQRVKLKEVRPFYIVPCINCHKATQYNKWLLSKKIFGTKVLYQVQWKHPWEPFFIARRDVPNFDERFKQYGMNRVSQVCELHVAGYKFFVLDNVFLIHRGFKTMDDFHLTKMLEMEGNRKIYSRFKEELKYKYPESVESC